MSITSCLSDNGEALTISIEGRFDASSLEQFRRSFENVDSDNIQRYVVDLAETVHLDSSALGMLLVLRDHAGGDKANIVIDNCSPEVKKIFAISSFEQLFVIE
ncbi:STAS domain-containing protein [Agarilytica rhodophyticola]|uniref:STAS domain-containing protein n=1 Tax=Agarilytica rhodophyticola TaxID=1737490 RepID=UPI000B3455F2|nr:STAS domain-containing protein [Agarilytica rhodophyticola]